MIGERNSIRSGQAQELGADVVVTLAERELRRAMTEAQRVAVRRAVVDGQVIAGKGAGATPAAVLITLHHVGVLSIADGAWTPRAGPKPTIAHLGERLLVACYREWLRRRSGLETSLIPREFVVEYLSALDARRGLASGVVTSSRRRLGGTALSRVIKGAQRRLDEAEHALRTAAVYKGA